MPLSKVPLLLSIPQKTPSSRRQAQRQVLMDRGGDVLACLTSMPHDIPGEQTASGHSAIRRAHTLTNQTSQPRQGLWRLLFVPLAPSTLQCPRQAPTPVSSVLQVTLLHGSRLGSSPIRPMPSLPRCDSVAPSSGSVAPTTLRRWRRTFSYLQPFPPVQSAPCPALAVGHSD